MTGALLTLAREFDFSDAGAFAANTPRVLEAMVKDGLAYRTDGGSGYVNTPGGHVALALFKELAFWGSGPTRLRLPNERPALLCKVTLCVEGAPFPFYMRVGRWPEDGSQHADRPLEVFLEPRGAVKAGSMLAHYAEDAGESLSLFLQHYYTPASLFHRFKKGSLQKNAAGALLVLSYEEGWALDEESAELGKSMSERLAAKLRDGLPILGGVRP